MHACTNTYVCQLITVPIHPCTNPYLYQRIRAPFYKCKPFTNLYVHHSLIYTCSNTFVYHIIPRLLTSFKWAFTSYHLHTDNCTLFALRCETLNSNGVSYHACKLLEKWHLNHVCNSIDIHQVEYYISRQIQQCHKGLVIHSSLNIYALPIFMYSCSYIMASRALNSVKQLFE